MEAASELGVRARGGSERNENEGLLLHAMAGWASGDDARFAAEERRSGKPACRTFPYGAGFEENGETDAHESSHVEPTPGLNAAEGIPRGLGVDQEKNDENEGDEGSPPQASAPSPLYPEAGDGTQGEKEHEQLQSPSASSASSSSSSSSSSSRPTLSWIDQIRYALRHSSFLGQLGGRTPPIETEEEADSEEVEEDLDDAELLFLQGVHVSQMSAQALMHAPHGGEPANVLTGVEEDAPEAGASRLPSSSCASSLASSPSYFYASSGDKGSGSRGLADAEKSAEGECESALSSPSSAAGKASRSEKDRADEGEEEVRAADLFFPTNAHAKCRRPPRVPELPRHGFVIFGGDEGCVAFSRSRAPGGERGDAVAAPKASGAVSSAALSPSSPERADGHADAREEGEAGGAALEDGGVESQVKEEKNRDKDEKGREKEEKRRLASLAYVRRLTLPRRNETLPQGISSFFDVSAVKSEALGGSGEATRSEPQAGAKATVEAMSPLLSPAAVSPPLESPSSALSRRSRSRAGFGKQEGLSAEEFFGASAPAPPSATAEREEDGEEGDAWGGETRGSSHQATDDATPPFPLASAYRVRSTSLSGKSSPKLQSRATHSPLLSAASLLPSTCSSPSGSSSSSASSSSTLAPSSFSLSRRRAASSSSSVSSGKGLGAGLASGARSWAQAQYSSFQAKFGGTSLRILQKKRSSLSAGDERPAERKPETTGEEGPEDCKDPRRGREEEAADAGGRGFGHGEAQLQEMEMGKEKEPVNAPAGSSSWWTDLQRSFTDLFVPPTPGAERGKAATEKGGGSRRASAAADESGAPPTTGGGEASLALGQTAAAPFPLLRPPLGFSFSPAGLLGPYHLGVLSLLCEANVINHYTPVAGASAGGLAAAAIGLNLSAATVMESVEHVCRDLIDRGTAHRLGKRLRKELLKLIPEDCADVIAKRPGRVTVTYTHVFPYMHGEFVSSFFGKSDMIDCLIASCNIPFYLTKWPTVTCRGRQCVDGFFATKHKAFGCPESGALRDIKVVPFYASTIRVSAAPQDCINPDLQLQDAQILHYLRAKALLRVRARLFRESMAAEALAETPEKASQPPAPPRMRAGSPLESPRASATTCAASSRRASKAPVIDLPTICPLHGRAVVGLWGKSPKACEEAAERDTESRGENGSRHDANARLLGDKDGAGSEAPSSRASASSSESSVSLARNSAAEAVLHSPSSKSFFLESPHGHFPASSPPAPGNTYKPAEAAAGQPCAGAARLAAPAFLQGISDAPQVSPAAPPTAASASSVSVSGSVAPAASPASLTTSAPSSSWSFIGGKGLSGRGGGSPSASVAAFPAASAFAARLRTCAFDAIYACPVCSPLGEVCPPSSFAYYFHDPAVADFGSGSITTSAALADPDSVASLAATGPLAAGAGWKAHGKRRSSTLAAKAAAEAAKKDARGDKLRGGEEKDEPAGAAAPASHAPENRLDAALEGADAAGEASEGCAATPTATRGEDLKGVGEAETEKKGPCVDPLSFMTQAATSAGARTTAKEERAKGESVHAKRGEKVRGEEEQSALKESLVSTDVFCETDKSGDPKGDDAGSDRNPKPQAKENRDHKEIETSSSESPMSPSAIAATAAAFEKAAAVPSPAPVERVAEDGEEAEDQAEKGRDEARRGAPLERSTARQRRRVRECRSKGGLCMRDGCGCSTLPPLLRLCCSTQELLQIALEASPATTLRELFDVGRADAFRWLVLEYMRCEDRLIEKALAAEASASGQAGGGEAKPVAPLPSPSSSAFASSSSSGGATAPAPAKRSLVPSRLRARWDSHWGGGGRGAASGAESASSLLGGTRQMFSFADLLSIEKDRDSGERRVHGPEKNASSASEGAPAAELRAAAREAEGEDPEAPKLGGRAASREGATDGDTGREAEPQGAVSALARQATLEDAVAESVPVSVLNGAEGGESGAVCVKESPVVLAAEREAAQAAEARCASHTEDDSAAAAVGAFSHRAADGQHPPETCLRLSRKSSLRRSRSVPQSPRGDAPAPRPEDLEGDAHAQEPASERRASSGGEAARLASREVGVSGGSSAHAMLALLSRSPLELQYSHIYTHSHSWSGDGARCAMPEAHAQPTLSARRHSPKNSGGDREKATTSASVRLYRRPRSSAALAMPPTVRRLASSQSMHAHTQKEGEAASHNSHALKSTAKENEGTLARAL
ncbi:hypothetical protein BESB_017460 [Besnoitia besnoiti]|uniref:PNPLA domain-containing protein n=1 Tax=Besnoitia besnoiti TaxID=94643 RepID=A0A2A9M1Q3_BESBE|nr:hypothetical protein BESB_017460 [Besnoitia besnoiti]PFH32428.1 hypothetical protein BESB_017460 [Besnoitia besnoiti]